MQDNIFSEGNRIGEGVHRVVYRHGNLAVKVLKSHITKRYMSVPVDFPMSSYTRMKYGVADYNQYEIKVYNSVAEVMPPGLRDSFMHIHSVGNDNGRSVSVSDLITDYDGQISMTAIGHGRVSDYSFWERMDNIEQFFIENGLLFMDMCGLNVLVRKGHDGKKTPVFIDYKKFGMRMRPFQVWLALDSQKEKFIKKRFDRFREKYKGNGSCH